MGEAEQNAPWLNGLHSVSILNCGTYFEGKKVSKLRAQIPCILELDHTSNRPASHTHLTTLNCLI
jgi:hypothetical protein